jgi:hypothetical protein
MNLRAAQKPVNSPGGPPSLPLNKRMELREMQLQTRSEDGCLTRPLGGSTSVESSSDGGAMAAVRCGTVITVRGRSDPHLRVNGAEGEYLHNSAAERPHSTSPNDRTSLLQSENPVS